VAARTSSPGTRAASAALSAGSTSVRVRPSRRAASASASAPRTGRRAPASDNSPANSMPSSRRASTRPDAARMPSAIGRSKRPDSLGRSAGARLTVTRLLCGKAKPLSDSAARTRSRDSRTSVSTRPTSVKLGRPLARCTSTRTAGASSPSRARLMTRARVMVGVSVGCLALSRSRSRGHEAAQAPILCTPRRFRLPRRSAPSGFPRTGDAAG
jgi:hypothetical protein